MVVGGLQARRRLHLHGERARLQPADEVDDGRTAAAPRCSRRERSSTRRCDPWRTSGLTPVQQVLLARALPADQRPLQRRWERGRAPLPPRALAAAPRRRVLRRRARSSATTSSTPRSWRWPPTGSAYRRAWWWVPRPDRPRLGAGPQRAGLGRGARRGRQLAGAADRPVHVAQATAAVRRHRPTPENYVARPARKATKRPPAQQPQHPAVPQSGRTSGELSPLGASRWSSCWCCSSRA